MDDVRAAEAVTSTLGRLQKCHGFLLAPADEDPKTKGFIKASKELVAKASDKLEPIDGMSSQNIDYAN